MNTVDTMRLGVRLGIFSVLTALSATVASAAETGQPVDSKLAAAQVQWRGEILKIAHPTATGCFGATYPELRWSPVPCGAPPKYPILPVRGPSPHFVVGGGGSNDFSANPTGTISAAEGTFVSLSPGLTEAGPVANAGPDLNDTYTLQINTDPMTSAACMGSPNPGCQGWEQFVYVNDASSHYVFIQYWLLYYNASCPAGWTQFSFTGSTTVYCYQSTGTASLMASHPVSDLGTMTLSGWADAAADGATIVAGGDAKSASGVNAIGASAHWADAEFNIFGDGGNTSGGGQAKFGTNSTVVVRTTVHNGTKNAPSCVSASYTGETNNMTMVGMSTIGVQPAPAIEFTESNTPGTAPACVTAAGIGDTHLSTFGGLFYDFQASGDFVLASLGSGFEVQVRQVSGAPNWPNASVNHAVAARLGKTRLAFCAPELVMVDGKATELAEGQIMALPGGVDIRRTANVYLAIDLEGNSVRAEMNGAYINATVGLGRWPVSPTGLLANAPGQVNQLVERNGSRLTAPFDFDRLYRSYADSWRVPARESLLGDCGTRETVSGHPQRPFYARELKPEVYKRAHAVCLSAGLHHPALLEACTLDVAVLGTDKAAGVFSTLRTPQAVGRIVPGKRDHDRDRD